MWEWVRNNMNGKTVPPPNSPRTLSEWWWWKTGESSDPVGLSDQCGGNWHPIRIYLPHLHTHFILPSTPNNQANRIGKYIARSFILHFFYLFPLKRKLSDWIGSDLVWHTSSKKNIGLVITKVVLQEFLLTYLKDYKIRSQGPSETKTRQYDFFATQIFFGNIFNPCFYFIQKIIWGVTMNWSYCLLIRHPFCKNGFRTVPQTPGFFLSSWKIPEWINLNNPKARFYHHRKRYKSR